VQYLFSGRTSLRTPAEWLWLILTCLFAPVTLGIAGFFLHEELGISTAALLLVVAMIFVTISRGQLLGSSVRIDAEHFPQIFHVVERCASMIGIPMPMVFVRDDNTIPVTVIGFGDPYALVLANHWIDHFKEDELTFMIGRELGHVAAGHTRFESLLSTNGKENAIVAFVFGAWLRRTEYTADRIGLLCCGSLDSAMRAIAFATVHHFSRKIHLETFAQQAAEISRDQILRMGEWLSAVPYATKRMAALRQFHESALYAYWAERFLENPASYVPASPVPRTGTVDKRDCVGWWRRFAATLLDCIVISALLTTVHHYTEQVAPGAPSPVASPAPTHARKLSAEDRRAVLNALQQVPGLRDHTRTVDEALQAAEKSGAVTVNDNPEPPSDQATFKIGGLNFGFDFFGGGAWPIWAFGYYVVLVVVAGQTLGMMIFAIRVVTTHFNRPGLFRVAVRAGILVIFGWLIIPLGFFTRVQWHDRLTGTRVIVLERALQYVTRSTARA